MRIYASVLALALVATPLAAKPAVPTVAAAIASSSRSADNVKLDESRKPAQVLNFLGLRPGMSALDLFGGNKYWAEIIAPVVGPKGHVFVWEPAQFYKDDTKAAFEAPILAKYEREGSPYHSSARLWDDGVIDPLDTRRVLSIGLQAATCGEVIHTHFGVFRM